MVSIILLRAFLKAGLTKAGFLVPCTAHFSLLGQCKAHLNLGECVLLVPIVPLCLGPFSSLADKWGDLNGWLDGEHNESCKCSRCFVATHTCLHLCNYVCMLSMFATCHKSTYVYNQTCLRKHEPKAGYGDFVFFLNA